MDFVDRGYVADAVEPEEIVSGLDHLFEIAVGASLMGGQSLRSRGLSSLADCGGNRKERQQNGQYIAHEAGCYTARKETEGPACVHGFRRCCRFRSWRLLRTLSILAEPRERSPSTAPASI